MTWVYRNTGSLLIAVLMHGFLDVFWILSTPNSLTGQQRMIWYIAWAVVLWAVVAILNRTIEKKADQFEPTATKST